MSEFKVGDRVYCPVYGGDIYTLQGVDSELYPLLVCGHQRFTVNGFGHQHEKAPSIFHATPENHALLSQLYPNVEFEKPKLTGSDLTRQLLAEGAKEVLCWVSDTSDEDAIQSKLVVCVYRLFGEHFDTCNHLGVWNHAVPIPRNHYAMDDE